MSNTIQILIIVAMLVTMMTLEGVIFPGFRARRRMKFLRYLPIVTLSEQDKGSVKKGGISCLQYAADGSGNISGRRCYAGIIPSGVKVPLCTAGAWSTLVIGDRVSPSKMYVITMLNNPEASFGVEIRGWDLGPKYQNMQLV